MAKETDRVRRFLEHFAAWADACPLILGVALVGSYARGDFREDSDVDLVVVTQDETRTLQAIRDEFRLEDIVDARIEEWGILTSLRVFYAGGLEVEYGVVTKAWCGGRWILGRSASSVRGSGSSSIGPVCLQGCRTTPWTSPGADTAPAGFDAPRRPVSHKSSAVGRN
ncbi:MAG: nucleotidyltransferase domain-containing protein [Clostridia bacterium]|nr:nucleotidyltransferase domain-containing protein [Clostridia bacterium]